MKQRLDILVAEKINVTRSKAQAIIMAGQVSIDGKIMDKPGAEIDDTKELEIKELFPYVSRGALKLEEAAKEFKIDFKEKVVCDIGASTGGFTDYVLASGAKKVYAIDVGTGQLASKLREDKRVVVMEKTNIKDVRTLPEKIDIFVIDVSFISLKKVLPKTIEIESQAEVVALVKPQFEVGKKVADKYKGIIRDTEIQLEVIRDIGQFAETLGFRVEGITESPIKGARGNREYLIYLSTKLK
ncbi:MAG: TlyA family RNA methyltransferase [Patescibacteria group bacterium]|nr:TlyA family RNA methyltransferase [Patescibacteria group bacterium]